MSISLTTRIKAEQLQALHAQAAPQEERTNNSIGEAGILQQETLFLPTWGNWNSPSLCTSSSGSGMQE